MCLGLIMFQSLYCIPITEEEAIKHFIYLQHAHIGDYVVEKKENEETTSRIGISTNGSKASNYFFQKVRFHTPHRNKGTYEEWIKCNGVDRLKELALKYSSKKSIEECKEHDFLSVLNLRVGTINQFKPRVAACLYELFKPSSVLDFSAGWGDRCVAAMAKSIDYIGIDTNIALKSPFGDMISCYKDVLKQQEKRIPAVDIYFQPSETFDFSSCTYDMVFTSPPYYDLEFYENMPTYESYEVWITTFLQPVITNAWKHMKVNGWMCLNLPSDKHDSRKITKYDVLSAVQEILGEPRKRIQMMLQQRNKEKNNATNCEYIYCWQKVQCIASNEESHMGNKQRIEEVKEEREVGDITTLKEENKRLKAENAALKQLLKVYL
jgi:hypothetical protein